MKQPDTPDLWQAVTRFEALNLAWAKVDHNAGSAGGDAVSRREFRDDAFARINQLRADLLRGAYHSRPFRKVSIPKKKPGYRVLTIPSIRDRIVHTAISTALTPHFEAVFEESSFAYRKGRGVKQAVARIEHWRDRGYDIVIEADIVGFFDNIQHDLLLEKITDTVGSLPGFAALLDLIGRILGDQAKALGTPGVGLVQGSPLSPLLANLYLDALDEEIERQGVKIVRFADDFVVLCKSEKKASQVLSHVVAVLGAHGLRLHDDGTRIVSFDRGFDFIGYLFVRSLALQEAREPGQNAARKQVKSEVTDEGIIQLEAEGSRLDQGGSVLYVLDKDHRFGVRNRSFSVSREDGNELIAVPHGRVGRIEIGPGVDVDPRAFDLAVSTNTDLAIVDGYGQTRGTVRGRQSRRAGLHLQQAAAVLDDALRLEIARLLVHARLANQREQVQRLNRRPKLDSVKASLKRLGGYREKVAKADSVASLLGFEGAAASEYWQSVGELYEPGRADAFCRSRPARDALNAVLNYLSAILERDVRASSQTAGLHLGFAFLHGSRDRHDGLVFDLMEPFRAPLGAGLAVFLFHSKRLRSEMFCNVDDGAVEISKDGIRAIIDGYESAVSRRVSRPDRNGSLGWRAMMLFQARTLASAVTSKRPDAFQPFLL